MHEYAPKQENKVRTLDAASRTSRQAPLQVILQCQRSSIPPCPATGEKLPATARAIQKKATARQPEKEAGTPDTKVMQRMILPLWNDSEDMADFLKQGEIQSRNLNHGKVIDRRRLRKENLSDIGEFEDLHIIGHGSSQTVAGMSPDELADLVVHELKLPPVYKGRIYLETCNSGTKPATLEGSYASRFIKTLNALRGKASSPLSAVGFAGTLVLDNSFPERTLFRVLKKDVTMEMYKEYTKFYIGDSADIINNFIEELNKQGLFDYVEPEDIRNLFFCLYNAKISTYAEPEGGALTKLSIWGTEYEGIPDAKPNIIEMMEQIKTQASALAEAEKASIHDIQELELDLGT